MIKEVNFLTRQAESGKKAERHVATDQSDETQGVLDQNPTASLAVGQAPSGIGHLTSRQTDVLRRQHLSGNAAVVRSLRQPLVQRDPPEGDAAPDEATALIERFSKASSIPFVGPTVDRDGLFQELVSKLPTQANLVISVIDKVKSSPYKLKNVETGLCTAMSDDVLAAAAVDPAGEQLVFKLVRAMQGFTTSAAEKTQLYRAMTALSKAENAKAGKVEVEVITFEWGGALDSIGQTVFREGTRGHTAVVVSGLAYSFAGKGWESEGTKSEYLGKNTQRDATGQVLNIPEPDAKKVQDRLNGFVGTGAYLTNADGNVCVDEAARALEVAIGTIDAQRSPQVLKYKLEGMGVVRTTNFYPRKAGAGKMKQTPLEQKTTMINGLLDGWVSDTDIGQIETVYNANTSDKAALRAVIQPRLKELNSDDQRKRLEKLIQVVGDFVTPSPKGSAPA